MTTREGTFAWWMTREEYSHDKRTGVYARITDHIGVWTWKVHDKSGLIAEGTSTSQKGARAACRRVARKLKSK
jgi:hypothetical protein